MLVKLCDKKDLPAGEIKSFKLKGKEIIAINSDGKIYCLDARCTHAGAPLAEGTLDGLVLTCPWHYSQFNVSNGSLVRGPAEKPLKIYRNEEKDDSLFVEI